VIGIDRCFLLIGTLFLADVDGKVVPYQFVSYSPLTCSYIILLCATSLQSNTDQGNRETQEEVCSAFSAFPNGGSDSSERMLLREGVIDKIPKSLCGNKGGKNVILVVGDGMGWEMVRAGAIGRKVVNELESIGCDIKAGCVGNTAAMARFEGRTLEDYYTEGK
jgi:hypothetical protein